MRPLIRASVFVFGLAACAPTPRPVDPAAVAMPEQPPQPDEGEEGATATEPGPGPAPAPASAADAPKDDPSTMLNGAWSATFRHDQKWADAIKNMRDARAAYVAAATPVFTSTSGVPAASEFQHVNMLLEQLNRRSAAAYYAPDATSEQRIEVLDEISTMLLRWSQKLDELGLTKTPASYRTNGKIALTFEDVVQGPAKRWRGEGLTLANLCVQRAKSDNVTTSAARACETLHKTYTTAGAPPPATQPECACPAGDPLCSASMNGWCKPGK
ncbi:MAG: hypothetical protein KIT84_05685 [Labilithrix sp.]|nr:hypothetical protein [Labilithrix sp.]MCW5810480.1 hypothetical protein [Labilithrix sp.]